jgi:hypothetical protein
VGWADKDKDEDEDEDKDKTCAFWDGDRGLVGWYIK